MSDPRTVTSKAAFTALARDAPPGARVPVEVQVSVSDPFLAYRRARECSADRGADATHETNQGNADGVYLETTGGQSGWGYFALDPISRLTVGSDLAPIGDPDPSPALAELAGLLDSETLMRGDCEVPYPCGAFGWLSYDLARELEDLPDTTARERDLPRVQLGVFDRVAAWKEPRSSEETTLCVTACPRIGDDPSAAYERGRERALDLARRATTGAVSGDPGIADGSGVADDSEVAGDSRVEEPPSAVGTITVEPECSRAGFEARVRSVKQYIRDGDTFQANVSQRLHTPAVVSPTAAFAALRETNPAPYSALVDFPGVALVSASPELLLDVEGDRLLTEPIAGTRPRGDTPRADAVLERDLLTDEKERAEHAMLVDLERNDLGKVSQYGSVAVSEYRRVDRYSEVMHLVSIVESRLRADRTLADAVAAVFPGGTITGAPKPRTMEIIDEVEATRRGPYTGSIGVFGFDGRATLNIAIRTLVGHEDTYSLRVGAGIVHDSEPESEYAETLDKGRALVTALSDALGDRGDTVLADDTTDVFQANTRTRTRGGSEP